MIADQPPSLLLLRQVLEVYRQPLRFREFWAAPHRPLPEGTGNLIDLALAPRDALDGHAESLRASRQELLAAIHFFIHQALLAEENDAYRMLGLTPAATPAEIKSRYRKLMRLYHPDRGGDNEWNSIYAPRINRAYHSLRALSRRAAAARPPPPPEYRRDPDAGNAPRPPTLNHFRVEPRTAAPRRRVKFNDFMSRCRPSPRWLRGFIFAASCVAAASGVGFIVWNLLIWIKSS